MKLVSSDNFWLREKALPVQRFEEAVAVVEDMWKVMRENGGIGLAAPQVGISAALVVIDVGDGNPLVLINPVITRRSGEMLSTEGCLSLPGETRVVRRPRIIEVCYTGLDGEKHKVRARKSLLARALEHELDHLSGVLIDRKT